MLSVYPSLSGLVRPNSPRNSWIFFFFLLLLLLLRVNQPNPSQQFPAQAGRVAPSHLTCFPWMRARRQRLTMFHEVLFSYRIRFRAMATCEWQLSQQRLCFEEDREDKWWRHFDCVHLIQSLPVPVLRRSYHPVLVLLGSIVHGCVPGIGAAGVDLANIKHPVPAGREKNQKVEHWLSLTLCNDMFSNKLWQDNCLGWLTWLVVQKPCCLPAKKQDKFILTSIVSNYIQTPWF